MLDFSHYSIRRSFLPQFSRDGIMVPYLRLRISTPNLNDTRAKPKIRPENDHKTDQS